jgi:hypothetical protein
MHVLENDSKKLDRYLPTAESEMGLPTLHGEIAASARDCGHQDRLSSLPLPPMRSVYSGETPQPRAHPRAREQVAITHGGSLLSHFLSVYCFARHRFLEMQQGRREKPDTRVLSSAHRPQPPRRAGGFVAHFSPRIAVFSMSMAADGVLTNWPHQTASWSAMSY